MEAGQAITVIRNWGIKHFQTEKLAICDDTLRFNQFVLLVDEMAARVGKGGPDLAADIKAYLQQELALRIPEHPSAIAVLQKNGDELVSLLTAPAEHKE